MSDAYALNSRIDSAIRLRHMENWVVWFEVRLGTGWGGTAQQSMDAFAMHEWPSESFHRVAYEIKISRGDFLRELKNPKKRRPAMRHSNQFYFITLPGVAKIEEIPADCGLIEVNTDGGLKEATRTVLDAPFRDSIPPSWRFLAGAFRRVRLDHRPTVAAPIPMMLYCPDCHHPHHDEGEWAVRPHKTHLCWACKAEWRPANVATVGVKYLTSAMV